ncbi:MAG: ATP-binding cassette domain-containing protein [Acetobacteraceae bacterium]|nr:ATP-binding cassette domain-containing protein [Acetobacteraceae bacterium]
MSVRYGEGTVAAQALERADLAFGRGDFVRIVGPSGCGKTTLMHTRAGFVRPSRNSRQAVRARPAPVGCSIRPRAARR